MPNPIATCETSLGTFTVELFQDQMPYTVENFVKLATSGFYDGLHYPTIGLVYTHHANRFSLAYVKQVEGINCAGGICRYEPTFHGVRLNISSSF